MSNTRLSEAPSLELELELKRSIRPVSTSILAISVL